MLGVDEIQVKLEDLEQAVAFEKRYRYINVQGRKKPFSQFVNETLRLLQSAGALNEEDPKSEKRQALLIQRFLQYADLDMGSRMDALDELGTYIQDQRYQLGLLQGTNSPGQARLTLQESHETTKVISEEVIKAPSSQAVQYLKGIGPRFAEKLAQVGIFTVEDLLYYFPRRYLDFQNRVKINQLQVGETVTILGTIQQVSAYNAKTRSLSVVSVTVGDETGQVSASWFYGKSHKAVLEQYKSRFAKGAEVMVSGRVKWDQYKRRFSIDKPQLEILSYAASADDEASGMESLHAGRIVPVYGLTEGLNVRFLRRAIHTALETYLPVIQDTLPSQIQKRYGLLPLQAALQQIHFPDSLEQYEDARKRLVFDELFTIQARLALTRMHYKQNIQGLQLTKKSGGYVEQLVTQLPFSLTNAQTRCWQEIQADLASSEPMYRMLMGDVGSGKTILALLCLLTAVENNYQGALMAPTEILAEQHYRRFLDWLTPLGLRVGLFVGKAGAKERREMRQSLLNGQIHLAVGTHALIQDDVTFAKLGVVVVDEQHRFGVRQRTQLKSKGEHPEMLTMTATPIPRSLAMTLHGDLDISLLDELPPGRTPIRTTLVRPSQQKHAYSLIRSEVERGRQAYIVFPLIEESETLSAKAATTEAERLQSEVFPEFRVGLLHGKMRPEEKESAMAAFVANHLNILVSTTVVEVGVDVPNATVMLIENADRFGLAQLHQLRGRVGRGVHASHCVLVCDSGHDETKQRLEIMTQTENGFEIAEKDLALRGPGEFLGTRQSGMPDLVLANLIQDKAILDMAREAAQTLVANQDWGMEYPELKAHIYQKTENTFSVLGSG
ncbi:MAG: ATP-dependent DNA helicase RecG [Cyanobacteria bacterium]|nr:ATP-dependent DNA helicase RecG [Cyanobacteriota bacterium]